MLCSSIEKRVAVFFEEKTRGGPRLLTLDVLKIIQVKLSEGF